MKIAVTADVHLTTREDNPERFNALEDILGSLEGLGIEHLIIAGDLFNKDILFIKTTMNSFIPFSRYKNTGCIKAYFIFLKL